ncbi:MAG: SpoVG family protein [Fibromonadaceae bacterium]|jgi:stage V sporulation protein G|nr:SpoVG family protein [Fibromonadaceae bacterium]
MTKNKGKGGNTFFDVLTCTNIQVYPFRETSGKTKAFARVTINDQLQLTGLRVVDGVNGFFVSYPIDPRHKGEDYQSVYYPLHKELREHIEQCVLEKYQEIIAA